MKNISVKRILGKPTNKLHCIYYVCYNKLLFRLKVFKELCNEFLPMKVVINETK